LRDVLKGSFCIEFDPDVKLDEVVQALILALENKGDHGGQGS
jgi:hypothetical protein